MAQKNSIKTPNAAVIIWNYKERLSGSNVNQKTKIDDIYEKIICTSECLSIQTNKSKSNPVGSFQIELAPTRNWVANITAGSWCVILMSNTKISSEDLQHVNPNQLKMIGKIETVRIDTQQVDDMRQTRYLVSGVDWGYIFNNSIHIDPFNDFENKSKTMQSSGNMLLEHLLYGLKKDDTGNKQNNADADRSTVSSNLEVLLKIFTGDMPRPDAVKAGKLPKSIYTVKLPENMRSFLRLQNPEISSSIILKTGALKQKEDEYEEQYESWGFINIADMIGTFTLWQVLVDNSSPAINEIFSDLRWNPKKNSFDFALYNRIKPFSMSDSYFVNEFNKSTSIDEKTNGYVKKIRSFFNLIKKHELDSSLILRLNTGTNWRDKCNFIEIRPDIPQMSVQGGLHASKLLQWDEVAFNREGFRPIIFATKQLPRLDKKGLGTYDPDLLLGWALLLREWFFDTHRLLNGSLTVIGSDEYIAVGNNVKFDLGLITGSNNMSNEAYNSKSGNLSVLGHIENISNSFTVDEFGARRFTTQIDFVRGIIVDKNSNKPVYENGKLDEDVSKNTNAKKTKNVIVTSNK